MQSYYRLVHSTYTRVESRHTSKSAGLTLGFRHRQEIRPINPKRALSERRVSVAASPREDGSGLGTYHF